MGHRLRLGPRGINPHDPTLPQGDCSRQRLSEGRGGCRFCFGVGGRGLGRRRRAGVKRNFPSSSKAGRGRPPIPCDWRTHMRDKARRGLKRLFTPLAFFSGGKLERPSPTDDANEGFTHGSMARVFSSGLFFFLWLLWSRHAQGAGVNWAEHGFS